MNDMKKIYWTASIVIVAIIGIIFAVLFGIAHDADGAVVFWSALLGAVLLFLFGLLYGSIYLYLQYKDEK